MMKSVRTLGMAVLALTMLSGCGLEAGIEEVDVVGTIAAQTAAVRLSQTPPATETPTPTVEPSATEELDITPTETATTTPDAGAGTSGCDVINIDPATVDQSYPDGSPVEPGQSFTKTWRLINGGSCTWTTSYQLVFISGDAMGGQSPQNLTQTVAPNQSIDLSVDLIAPSQPGVYRGNWMLQNASGTYFGVGGTTEFWVEIVVGGGGSATGTPGSNEFSVTGVTISLEGDANPTNVSCPHTFSFVGFITAQGIGTVSFYWDFSGNPSSVETLVFTEAGTKQITKTLSPDSSYSGQPGTAVLIVTSPNAIQSNSVQFSFTCQ